MNTETVSREEAEREVWENRKFFEKHVAEWQKHHFHHHALLHKLQLVDFYENERDAYRTGVREFGLGRFSIQSVADRPVELGGIGLQLFGPGRPGG